MTEQPLGPAGPLVAQIVQANVDALARTTDSIQLFLEGRLRDMSQAYVELYEAVDREEVLPRSLVRYLDRAAWDYSTARKNVTEETA